MRCALCSRGLRFRIRGLRTSLWNLGYPFSLVFSVVLPHLEFARLRTLPPGIQMPAEGVQLMRMVVARGCAKVESCFPRQQD